MEIYATRLALRNSLQARLGYSTNDTSSSLVVGQYNEFLNSAARAVYAICKDWTNALREYFPTVAVDQRFIDYPASATAANIQSVGCWDSGTERYRLLRRGRIQIPYDAEPLKALYDAGDADALVQWPARRGFPLLYETKAQIEIWPPPDQEYELKIDYMASPDLANDTDTCIIDGEAILLYALADAYDFQGDSRLADIQRQRFNVRIGQLRAKQHSGEPYQQGRLNRLVANGATIRDGVVLLPGGILPNSGTWPAVMP